MRIGRIVRLFAAAALALQFGGFSELVEASESESDQIVRPETLPGEKLVGVPALSDDGAADMAPGSVPQAKPSSGFVPGKSAEDKEARAEYSSVFMNPDGSRTEFQNTAPQHFRAADDSWQPIDSRVITRADGSLGNAANSWTVDFGPAASFGIAFTLSGGERLSWHPANPANDAKPEIQPDGQSVRYADVWPGVDLLYRVTPSGLEESVEIKSAQAPNSFAFTADGQVTVAKAQDEKVTGTSGLVVKRGEAELNVSPPESFDGKGAIVDAEAGVTQAPTSVGGEAGWTLGVSRRWLSSLPADRFPVLIDPTISPVLYSETSYPSPGSSLAEMSDGYSRVGNPMDAGSPDLRWRSVRAFLNAGSGINNLVWTRVTGAQLTMTPESGSTAAAFPVSVSWADE